MITRISQMGETGMLFPERLMIPAGGRAGSDVMGFNSTRAGAGLRGVRGMRGTRGLSGLGDASDSYDAWVASGGQTDASYTDWAAANPGLATSAATEASYQAWAAANPALAATAQSQNSIAGTFDWTGLAKTIQSLYLTGQQAQAQSQIQALNLQRIQAGLAPVNYNPATGAFSTSALSNPAVLFGGALLAFLLLRGNRGGRR